MLDFGRIKYYGSSIYMDELNFTNDVEGVLENIRINSAILHDFHRKQFISLNGKIKYYRIPVLIFSSIASVWAVSADSFLPQEQVSLTSSALGLIASLITSIELFEKIDEKMKLAEELSHKFYTMSVEIFKMLSLYDKNRGVSGKEYLSQVFSEYVKMVEKSDLTSKKLKDKLMPLPQPLHELSLIVPPNTPMGSNDSSSSESECITNNNYSVDIV
tara:strand:+ start:388 stop:1035 length:648 start_codon:yes stop_codon:yes gene_type:complete